MYPKKTQSCSEVFMAQVRNPVDTQEIATRQHVIKIQTTLFLFPQ